MTREKHADYGKHIVAAVGRQLSRSHFQSGIHVAEYLTARPSRELLQQKLHAAIEISRARLEAKDESDLDDDRFSNLIEAEAKETDKALGKILKQLRI